MLNIPVYVVNHFVTILAVLCEKEVKVDVEAFEAFCNEFLDWFYSSELKWNHQNVSVKILQKINKYHIIFLLFNKGFVNRLEA